uniref:uncharacterized protein C12orf42 homolog n=1 Tax=Jaculus jaculus TaxID=51337 RepID=UPI001E1B2F9C|nr:uncharacterized protein C12orf42 homolog [Jaculus jaculus]
MVSLTVSWSSEHTKRTGKAALTPSDSCSVESEVIFPRWTDCLSWTSSVTDRLTRLLMKDRMSSDILVFDVFPLQLSHSPRYEKSALPCSRFVKHMRNFCASHKFNSLHFMPVPGFLEGAPSALQCKKLLCTRQFIIPRSSMSRVSLDEESFGEACVSPAPSSEIEEEPLVFTVKEEGKKRDRGILKQAWSSPYLEHQLTNKPVKPPPVRAVSLEAAGRHIPLQNHPTANSKGNPGPKFKRTFSAIGLCRSFQNPCAQQSTWRTSSEPKPLEPKPKDRAATPQNSQGASHPDFLKEPLIVSGSALGVPVAMAPETLAKEGRRRAVTSFPQLSSRPCSKGLINVCSLAPHRPLGRFHKACSQALPRPVVNAALNARLR